MTDKNQECILLEPETTNILGLLLKTIIDRNIKDLSKSAAIKNLTGQINIKAGRMLSCLTFDKGEVTIKNNYAEKAKAEIAGTLNAFMNISVGANPVCYIFKREVKIKGNVLFLLKIMKIVTV